MQQDHSNTKRKGNDKRVFTGQMKTHTMTTPIRQAPQTPVEHSSDWRGLAMLLTTAKS